MEASELGVGRAGDEGQWEYREMDASDRVGHRVLFPLVRSVLFRSLKGTFCSFPFFFRVFGDL